MLFEKLNWRYATKKMDPARAVPADAVERIVEAARLAPSSSGLQPFEVIVVENAETREKIKAIANGQTQITDGSHLLVFAAWDTYTPERITAVFDDMAAARGGLNDGLIAYRQRLIDAYPNRDARTNFEHAARQAYIAFGFAIVAAAFEGIDATPMEGFDPAKLDEILGLPARGLRSVTILPLGYRDAAGDWLVSQPKVRRPLDRFLTTLR